jgi:hypothetical protein
MGEAAFFFEPRAALLIERALAWKQAFLPAGQEYVVEFESLGNEGHQRDGVSVHCAFAVHDQRDMFEKSLKIFELHGAYKLFQVVETSGCIGGAILCHISCSRSIQ